MKHETRVSDLTKTAELYSATQRKDKAHKKMCDWIAYPSDRSVDVADTYAKLVAARNEVAKAEDAVRKIPLMRRSQTQAMLGLSLSQAHAACLLAKNLSGHCTSSTEFGPLKSDVRTSRGAPYGGIKKWFKTDRHIKLTIDPEGIPLLYDKAIQGNHDGVVLVGAFPDGRVAWAQAYKSGIKVVHGYMARDTSTAISYHSERSQEHADAGLAKKVQEWRDALPDPKRDRRLRLIARLCHDTKATLKDALSAGFCKPGIESFQARFGIKNTATLPELVKTGDPSAVMLALRLAAKIGRKTT